MERSLLVSVFTIGLVGWLCGLLVTRARRAGETPSDNRLPLPFLVTAIALPFLGFLVTLPTHKPFASGQDLGRGFLLGGLGALLAAGTLLRARNREQEVSESGALQAAIRVATPYFLALLIVAATLLWMRNSLLDALLGISIGWFAVTIVCLLGLSLQWSEQGSGDRGHPTPYTLHPTPSFLPLVSGIGFVITLCAVSALSEFRHGIIIEAKGTSLSWSALSLTFAAGVPFTLLLGALPTSFFARIALRLPLANLFTRLSGRFFQSQDAGHVAARGWRLVFCIALLLGLGKLLTRRAIGEPDLFLLLSAGMLTGLIAWWVTASRLRQEQEAADAPTLGGWHKGALEILVLLAGTMTAYQMLAGLGIGLLLLAVWLPVALALAAALEPTEAASASTENIALPTATNLLRLALFGVVLLLYRLFLTRFDHDLHGVALTDQYAVFGFLLGAMLPASLAAFLLRPAATTEGVKGRRGEGEIPTPNTLLPVSSGSQLLRLVVVGALALAVPALVLIIWGTKCALTLLIGLALAVATSEGGVGSWVLGLGEKPTEGLQRPIPDTQHPTPNILLPTAYSLFPALFALAVALALTQWTHHILPYALLSRADKIRVLTWVIGSLIALILLSDYGSRFGTWLHKRRQGGKARVSAEGAAK